MHWDGVLKTYSEFLPITDKTPLITLLEGNTPLVKSLYISELVGAEVYLKYEGLNPTGSFKDRGMVMAVAKAIEDGATATMCASTGNTSASASAYAARYGLTSIVVVPRGNIALGKLAQALIHGAKVFSINGNFDDALYIVKEITDKYKVALVNSINPYRIEGQKTASFEVIRQLGGVVPDYLALPVGNAGNITAYWKGFKEYKEKGYVDKLPKMLGFQAEGASPIVKGHPIKDPKTVATAIKIGNPASWKYAEFARDESGGLIDSVTDDEIISAYKLLAQKEGVFVEPASSASIAGVLKLSKKGFFKNHEKIVCVLTGHGLKDPDLSIRESDSPIEVEVNIDQIVNILGLEKK
ncbi:MAG TPA: threonine synthase [Candidatus Atribacteria bacterium]|nr:threonine synthase [Candidatus Atribacteria bacterium]